MRIETRFINSILRDLAKSHKTAMTDRDMGRGLGRTQATANRPRVIRAVSRPLTAEFFMKKPYAVFDLLNNAV